MREKQERRFAAGIVVALVLAGAIMGSIMGCGEGGISTVRPEDIPEGMVFIPSGKFIMGTDETNFGLPGSNRRYIMGTPEEPRTPVFPERKVHVDAFFIDKYEVTNEQFCEFLNEMGNQFEGKGTWLDIDDREGDCLIEERDGKFAPKPGYVDHPVVEVTSYGANAYAKWAGKRLPTETEWEKAARGTDGRKYPWGNKKFYSGNWRTGKFRANVDGGWDGYEHTAPVGSFENGKSPYGLYDMAGNASEWCSDPYDERLDPVHGHEHRVKRGGSWHWGPFYLRSVARDFCGVCGSQKGLGFRCAMDVKAPEPEIIRS